MHKSAPALNPAMASPRFSAAVIKNNVSVDWMRCLAGLTAFARARVRGDQSAALSKDAAKLGTVALNRIADGTGRRPLFALAVPVGVGILIGMAARNTRMGLSR